MLVANDSFIEEYWFWKILDHLRNQFERAWSTDTAHCSVKYSKETVPASAGQCFVTSWVLMDYLCRNFQLKNIVVCRGALYHSNTNIIDNHCWVEVITEQKKYIIDLTQDQATCNRVYVKSEGECQRDGFTYKSLKVYENEELVKPEAIMRAIKLKKRLGWSTNA